MMHSHLTRWIEDADARTVFLEITTMLESQSASHNQYIHLGHTIKKVFSWWHHGHDEHRLFSDHGSGTARH